MKKIAATILGFILFTGIIFWTYINVSERSRYLSYEGVPADTYFYRTQNDADCILIKNGDAAILIDTGEKADSEGIIRFLEDRGVQTVDFLILTHYDKDHTGGALDIMDNLEIKNVIKPYQQVKTPDVEIIDRKLEDLSIPVIYPLHTRTFSVGGMNMTVYPPLEKRYSDGNNYSIATMVSHGKVRMLFAGDAMYKRINELLSINWPEDIRLLKVPHHGRQRENSGEFIRTIDPDFMVITSDKADEAVIEAGREVGSEVFFSRNENLHFASDGKLLKMMEESE